MAITITAKPAWIATVMRGLKQHRMMPPNMHGMPTCSVRSLCLAELQAMTTMPIAAQKYGMADRSVACRVLTEDVPPLLVLPVSAVPANMFLMMIGIHVLRLQTHSTAAKKEREGPVADEDTQLCR